MVYTADVEGAGTDANVHIMLVGPKGNSGKKTLDTAGNNFERGKTDTFFFNCADVGDVTSIQIGHDNAGAGPAWYLSQVVILCEETNKQYMFYCERWLAKDEDDGNIERELIAGEAGRHLVYVVTVRTGDKSGAGTDANVFITLYGEKGDCGQRKLNKPGNNFERGHADRFELKSRDLGNITKIKIGHDNSGVGSAWFLGHVIVQVKDDVKRLWYFESNRWFSTKEDDKAIVREINASKELPPNIDINANTPSNALTNPKEPDNSGGNSTIANKNKTAVQNFKYKLLVQTGDISGAGTDANVLITLYGDKGSSGTLKLDNKYNNFERGQKDEFNLDLPDLGNLDTVKISHDNTGFGPAWFLEFVIVIREDSSKQWFFPCNRWLATDEEDHKIERELYVSEDTSKSAFNKSVPRGVPEKSSKPAASVPKSNTYKISVATGKIFGAGTDANVFIILYGDKDTSSQYTLNNKGVNDFERGSTIFSLFFYTSVQITVEKTLGKLKKIRIGHDNKGAGAAWFLDYVLIHSENDNMDYRFDCGKWLSKDEGDKLFVRDLLPLQSK